MTIKSIEINSKKINISDLINSISQISREEYGDYKKNLEKEIISQQNKMIKKNEKDKKDIEQLFYFILKKLIVA